MNEYGVFKWKLKTNTKLDYPNTKLRRIFSRLNNEYENTCINFIRKKKQLGKLKTLARRQKAQRYMVGTILGREKGIPCPALHPRDINAKGYSPRYLCIIRKKTWKNNFIGDEFFYWICLHCKMTEDRRNTRTMMAKLTKEWEHENK